MGEVEEHDMSGLEVGCMRIAYAKAVGQVAEDNHLAQRMEPAEIGAVLEGVVLVVCQGRAVVEKEAARRESRKTEEVAGMMAGSEKHR